VVGAPKGCWSVPFGQNPRFVGRSTLLAELETKLAPTGHAKKVALIGLGGIGKTQIALELAYRTRAKFASCSVFWVPALSRESVRKAYVDIGEKLSVAGLDEPKADVFGLVRQHLSSESAGQWLLILDNADDDEMWFAQPSGDCAGAARLVDCMPRSPLGATLITTRSRKVAVKMASSEVVAVPELDERTSLDLLRKALIDPALLDVDGVALALLKQLTFLPLAIVQAAAYINANEVSLAEYLSLLGDTDETLVELLSEHFEDEGRYPEAKNPIATTWLISFEHIRRRDALAADYLSFMACVEPKMIPMSLFPEAKSKKKMLDAIGTLTAYSFVTKRPDGKYLDLHRLVHLATRNWLDNERQLAGWTGKVLAHLVRLFPFEQPTERERLRAYLPHVQRVLEVAAAEEHVRTYLLLLDRFGGFLQYDGRYAEAEASFAKLITARLSLLGQEHPDMLKGMANLATAYWHQGRWAEAEQLEVQVLALRKRVLGEEHPSTLSTLAHLASTYLHQGRWAEAEQLAVQVLELRKRVLGQEHPDTLRSMANLAATYSHQDRWAEAEQLAAQVLELRKRGLGPEHPVTFTRMANLAVTYSRQGRWAEAEQLGVQALELRKRVLGLEHPDTLSGMANLAVTYARQDRWAEAERLAAQVLELRRRVLGPEHPEVLTSMETLASTYSHQGRWAEAEQLAVQVLELRKRVLGQEHPNTLRGIASLAQTYWDQGQWAEAEKLEAQVLELSQRVLGTTHSDTLVRMHNLTFTWKAQGHREKALLLLSECHDLQKQKLGVENPHTRNSAKSLDEWRAEC
jgi:tetratricopeptide (TPR) repeat protein